MSRLWVPGLMALFLFSQSAKGQVEVEPWGNITGIRVEGQLMEFESTLNVVGNNWSNIQATAKERQRPLYSREGNKQIITTQIDSVYFKEVVEDSSEGVANVSITVTAHSAVNMRGIFFGIKVPGMKGLALSASGIKFTAAHRQLELTFDRDDMVTGPSGGSIDSWLYVPIQQDSMQTGQVVQRSFIIKATGDIDRTPIHLSLNTTRTGRAFAGLGGNFRIQNPTTDPGVIDYNLEHLRVAWARVEFPWRFWQPGLTDQPVDSAMAGKIHPAVQRAINMASRLSKKGIPLILSAWFPPDWAIEGPYKSKPGPDGVWGNPLSASHMEDIYASITGYILYLKKAYGVEIKLFSFNESDLGINVRMTAQQHNVLIKALGAYFIAHGLGTKMLLGDNSDATTYAFIDPAMNDAGALPYIGAVSFHSWRGWDTATLQKWADAASRLKLPLIVAEGSIDAAAWNYPAIFREQTYALKEISLYTRLLAICQPVSILQWQLTTDYSLLTGGGVWGDNGPLTPTQRFWNLKQLADTPPGLMAMPLTCDRPEVVCAALGDNVKGVYVLHLVNNGASRAVVLSGLPTRVKQLRVYITNKNKAVEEEQRVAVSKGMARFTLEAMSYVSLISE